MRKTALTSLLAFCMLVSGCADGSAAQSALTSIAEPAADATAESSAVEESTVSTTEETETAETENSKVLNIFCLNDMVQNVVKNCYPEYVDNGDGTGYIGDLKVVWCEAFGPNCDGDYSIALEYAMERQPELPAEERIDIVIIEPDSYYGQNFIDSEWALPLSDVGITDADTAQMYEFTKQLGTDSSGKLKALTCHACAGVFAYRRSIAQAVLGTDDPSAVQQYVADWDGFTQTAQLMKDSGYYMHISFDEVFGLFYQAAETPMIDYDKETIAPALQQWAEQTALYLENGYITRDAMWTSEWADAMQDGSTFGCFMPTWGIEFTVPGNAADSAGDWAICEGPAPYYSGCTFLAPAYMTDSHEEVGEFLRTLCCNSEVMKAFCDPMSVYSDMPNNMEAVAKYAASDAYKSDFLGGQNPYTVYHNAAKAVDVGNVSGYDATWEWKFIQSMKPYIFGQKTYGEALADFFAQEQPVE